jgi:hypothetical protein
MRKLIILMVIGSVLSLKLYAIKLETGLTKSTGIVAGTQQEFFPNDGGFVFGASFQLKENIDLIPKLEFAIVPFGTTTGLRIGPSFSLFKKERIQLSVYPAIYQGIALFRPESLYTWGTSLEGFFTYQFGKKSSLQLGTGIRYISCPTYKQYGQIASFVEIPLTLSYIYHLKNH